MGCAFSGNSEGVNRTTKRKPLHELIKSCQERLLSAIHCYLATDLKICLSEARSRLDNWQGTVDSCAISQKKLEEIEPKPSSNRWIRTSKRKRVDVAGSICVFTGMANEFRQLTLNDPFLRLRTEELHTLTENLKQVIKELQNQEGEINESLRSNKQSLNVWNAVLTAVSIGVQVCCFVLLVLGVPAMAVTAGTTTGTVIKTALEEWIGLKWGRQRRALKEDKLAVEIMQGQLQQVFLYLQSVETLVRMVKRDYSALAIEMELLSIHHHDEEAFKKRLKEAMAKFNGGELKAAIISSENKADECNKMLRVAEEALRSIHIP